MNFFCVNRAHFNLAVLAPLVIGALSCSTTNERQAPFIGRVISVDTMVSLDSAYEDTLPIDLTYASSMIIYDRQFDGVFDDTLLVFGDESGEFAGVLLYDMPFNFQANWLRRTIHLLIPEVGIDTHLPVEIQLPESGQVNELKQLIDWGDLRAPDTSFSIFQTMPKRDSVKTP